ncbi:MAG: HAD family hydrolase [Methanomassiliicoccus sp.]|nr:HAD family hydrolase [Methanomassiliicoccus sp.]
MTPRVLLIDLGGTLVDFFGHTLPGLVLPSSLDSARRTLMQSGREVLSLDALEARWGLSAQSPNDPVVRPLEHRLSITFDLRAEDTPLLPAMCRSFMTPLFGQARVFEDALPFLDALLTQGYEAVIVSNTTWGSPADLWREQLARTGIGSRVRGTVFCRDVGWRKPDPHIFTHALEVAKARPEECLFVGDNPVWDVDGPRRMGIPGVLLDRRVEFVGQGYDRVINLYELADRLQL